MTTIAMYDDNALYAALDSFHITSASGTAHRDVNLHHVLFDRMGYLMAVRRVPCYTESGVALPMRGAGPSPDRIPAEWMADPLTPRAVKLSDDLARLTERYYGYRIIWAVCPSGDCGVVHTYRLNGTKGGRLRSYCESCDTTKRARDRKRRSRAAKRHNN